MLLVKVKRTWRVTATWLKILVITLGVITLLAILKPAPKQQQVDEKTWRVTTTLVWPGDYHPSLTLLGKVESPDATALSSMVQAQVAEVFVNEGEKVDAGQLLIQLDDKDLLLALSQREADLQDAQARLQAEQLRFSSDQQALAQERKLLTIEEKTVGRHQSLSQQQLGAPQQLDAAQQALERQKLAVINRELVIAEHPSRIQQLQAQIQKAQAMKDKAELNVQRTQVSASFTGKVTHIRVAPDSLISIGAPMLDLYPIGELEVRAQLPNRLITLIRESLAAPDSNTLLSWSTPSLRPEIPVACRAISRPLPGDGFNWLEPETLLIPQLMEQAPPSTLTKPATLYAHASTHGQTIRLQLVRLSGEIDARSGGMDGLFSVISGQEFLIPGQILELSLELPAVTGAIALPQQAIHGLNRIYAVNNERLTRHNITRLGDFNRGPSQEPWLIISAPSLPAGSEVLTTQLPDAISGLKVQPTATWCP